MAIGDLQILVTADSNQARGDINSFAQAVQASMDKSTTALKSAQQGVTQLSSVTKSLGDTSGIEASVRGMDHMRLATAGVTRELLVLTHEGVQGNFSRLGGSLIVLAERLDLSKVIFSATGAAIGGLGLAVAALGYGFIKGAQQSKDFTNALALTGSFAGITEGKLNSLVQATSESTKTSLGVAREAVQSVISTGRVTETSLASVADATALVAKLSGKSTEDVAGSFAKLADGVAKGAADMNNTFHFLTASQFVFIEQLEKQGKVQEAIKITADLLTASLSGQQHEVGTLANIYGFLSEKVGQAKDALLSLGRSKTTEDSLALINERLQIAKVQNPNSNRTANLEKEKAALIAQQNNEIAAAAKKSQEDQQNAAIVGAKQFYNKFADDYASNAEKRKKAIDEYNKNVVLLNNSGVEKLKKSTEQQAKDIAAINEKYKDQKAPSANPLNKAEYENVFKQQQAVVAFEAKILQDRSQFLDRYYKDDLISIRDYFQARRDAEDEQLQHTIDAYEKEKAAAESYIKASQGNADKVQQGQTNLALIKQKIDEAQTQAATKNILLSLDQSKATRDYNDSVERLNIALLNMQGRLTEAAIAQEALNTRQQLQKANTEQNDKETDLINQIKDRTIAQAQLNENLKTASVIEQNLATAEGTANLAALNGDNNQLESISKLAVARREQLAQLSAIAEKNIEIARSTGNPETIAAAEAFRLKIQQMGESTQGLGQITTSVFANMENSLVSFTTTGKLNFASFAQSIINDLIKIQVKQSVIAPLTQFFGGGFISSPAAVGGGGSGPLEGLIDGAYADGGYANAGGAYLVGERGPELFLPKTSGTVIPNGQGLGGSSTIQNISLTVHSSDDAQSIAQTIFQVLPGLIKQGAEKAIVDQQRSGGRLAAA